MRLHIVFVKFRNPGVGVNGDMAVRYIDSQWASLKHATDRKGELSNSMRMANLKDWEIDIVSGLVADAAIASSETA